MWHPRPGGSGREAAGVKEAPILDWLRVAMRLRHLEQIAGGLPADDPPRAAKAVIVTEIDRLHWRLWNGKAPCVSG
ncbi:hypothetical protein [Rhodopila globiformis]|uniref:hypothetical protein n=1 Tax=Rhodopila globiformis TaxID=1071 RepID=UPI0011B0F1AC|nr:hypothetical protein [Rhodopila globiformis]